MNSMHRAITGRGTSFPRRSGLTLVELLAATVLAVLLMSAVLGVLKTVTERRALIQDRTIREPWQDRLQEQLEWDLTNSRMIRPVRNGIELTGFAGRNFPGDAVLHCPAVILYIVDETADVPCLLRTEIHPDSLKLDNRTTELVCMNVNGIVVGAIGDESGTAARDPATTLVASPSGDLPPQLSVHLFSPTESTSIFSHAFSLR